MKKVFLSGLLGLAIVFSCGKKHEETANHEAKVEATTDEHSDHAAEVKSDDHDDDAKLELNNGAKWAMNAEMKPHIDEMENLLNNYKPETDDYKVLGEKLSAANDQLIKSCTITGTPHDVLHAWLSPHMKEIDKLKKAENRQKANKIAGELKESMETYHEYFD